MLMRRRSFGHGQSFAHEHSRLQASMAEWHSIANVEANRYKLENGNAASEPFVTEAIRAEVEEIFETGSLLLQSLGYPIFEPLTVKPSGKKKAGDHATEWFLKGPAASAKAVLTPDGIVVRAGSLSESNLSRAQRTCRSLESGTSHEDGSSASKGRAMNSRKTLSSNRPVGLPPSCWPERRMGGSSGRMLRVRRSRR